MSAKKKDCVKITYDIKFLSADNVPVTGNVYIEWKRGNKSDNRGETKHVAVRDKKATFAESVSIKSTLLKDKKGGYEAKNISIALKEEKGKKGSSIAKTVIDLAEFAGNKDEKRTFSLKAKKAKVPPTLSVQIVSKESTEAVAYDDDDKTDLGGTTEGDISDEEDESGEDFEKDDSSTKSSGSRSNSVSIAKSPFKSEKRDSASLSPANSNHSAEVEELRAELEKAKDREAKAKTRIRELAEENVNYEEQVEELKKQLEKKGVSSPSSNASTSNDADKKKIKELTQRNEEIETKVADLEKQLAESKKTAVTTVASPSGSSEREQELKTRVRELATENVNLEEEVAELKKQLESKPAGKSSSSSNDDSKRLAQEAEMKKTIKELSADNGHLEDQLQDLRRLLEDIKKAPSSSANVSVTASSDADLKKISDQQREIEKLKQQLEDSKKDKSEIQDLSKDSRAEKERKAERERYEQEIEDEKKARKKAEKETKELRERLRDLEENSHHDNNNSKSVSAAPSGGNQPEFVLTLYETPAKYDSAEGVSHCALGLWDVLRDAPSDDSDTHARVVDVITVSYNRAPNDMNMLFYWLSTTLSLLHMLRDDPVVPSDNDRDPIIDGIFRAKKPNSTSQFQDQLEWVAFSCYKQLLTVICDKLAPLLAPGIIDQSVDKKSQGKNTPVRRTLDRILARTRQHYLYDAVVQQLFVQIFYFMNCHLVNTVLQKDRLGSNLGLQIKLGISHLDDWLASGLGNAERGLLAPCSEQLDAIREAANVLVVEKALFADAQSVQNIFRSLNLRQIKQLLQVFEVDKLPSQVRENAMAMWNVPQATSLPLLLDENQILDFVPILD